jgi:hypothetical protein
MASKSQIAGKSSRTLPTNRKQGIIDQTLAVSGIKTKDYQNRDQKVPSKLELG